MQALGRFTLAPNGWLFGILVSATLLGSCRGPAEMGGHQGLVAVTPPPVAPPPVAPPPLGSATRSIPASGDFNGRVGRVRGREQARRVFHSPGLFIGPKLAFGDVEGDLDGSITIPDNVALPSEFVFIPDIEESEGVGINVGYRWEEWEIVLSWTDIEYDAEFAGAVRDTRIQYIDLMFRQYYWIGGRLQPFLTGGLGASAGLIEDGALGSVGVEDAKLVDGITFNFGAGIAFYPHPWLSVFGMAMYRFGRYDTVEGTFGRTQVESTIDSDAWEVSTGVTFRLLGGRD